MTIEEANSFIVEMRAVQKMSHYLPLELLETHVQEIMFEIKTIIEMAISDNEKAELIECLKTLKDNFENEIHKR